MQLSSLYWLLWQAQTHSQCAYLDVCWGLRTIGRHISASVHVVLWQCKAANCLIITWKAGTRAAVFINMHLFTRGARTALLPHSDLSASRPVGRSVGRQWRKVLTTGSRASYRSRAAAARSCSPSSPVSSSATRSRSACGIFRGARRHICHRLVWRSPPLPLSPKPPWLRTTGSGRGCTLPWFCFVFWTRSERVIFKMVLKQTKKKTLGERRYCCYFSHRCVSS